MLEPVYPGQKEDLLPSDLLRYMKFEECKKNILIVLIKAIKDKSQADELYTSLQRLTSHATQNMKTNEYSFHMTIVNRYIEHNETIVALKSSLLRALTYTKNRGFEEHMEDTDGTTHRKELIEIVFEGKDIKNGTKRTAIDLLFSKDPKERKLLDDTFAFETKYGQEHIQHITHDVFAIKMREKIFFQTRNDQGEFITQYKIDSDYDDIIQQEGSGLNILDDAKNILFVKNNETGIIHIDKDSGKFSFAIYLYDKLTEENVLGVYNTHDEQSGERFLIKIHHGQLITKHEIDKKYISKNFNIQNLYFPDKDNRVPIDVKTREYGRYYLQHDSGEAQQIIYINPSKYTSNDQVNIIEGEIFHKIIDARTNHEGELFIVVINKDGKDILSNHKSIYKIRKTQSGEVHKKEIEKEDLQRHGMIAIGGNRRRQKLHIEPVS